MILRGVALACAVLWAQVVLAAPPTVRIDGSSTVYPVSEAVAEEFQIAQRGKVRVTVGISGTGGGFKKFCRGEIDIAAASRPIREGESKHCREKGIRFIELPIAFDAITVAVNPRNDWVDHLTVEELRRIWSPQSQGRITRWNQIRPQWPDKPLRLFGPGVDSGTFDYFTKAIVGKEHSSRGDFTASEDDNVILRGIAGDRYALGYLPYAYYAENRELIRPVPIFWKGHTKKPVLPSPENVARGLYQPLGRPIFIYVNAERARKRPEVRAFVEFYLTHAEELCREVGYLPLPKKAYELGLKRLRAFKTGTVFSGGSQIGVSIEELLKKETKE